MPNYTRAFARAVSIMNNVWPNTESTLPATHMYTKPGRVYVTGRSVMKLGKKHTTYAPTTDYLWCEAEKVSGNKYRIAEYSFQRYPDYDITGDACVRKTHISLKSGRSVFEEKELFGIFNVLERNRINEGWNETDFQPFQNRYFRDILTEPEKTKAPEAPTP